MGKLAVSTSVPEVETDKHNSGRGKGFVQRLYGNLQA